MSQITIEYNGQRVECRSEAEATKALRKLKREAKAKAERESAARETALRRAEAVAFNLIESAAAVLDEGSGRCFAIHRPGEDWYDTFVKPEARGISAYSRCSITCDTHNGRAVYETWNVEIPAIMLNSGGYLRAVKHQDAASGKTWWCAVGVCDNQACLLAIPDRFSALVDEAVEVRAARKAASQAAEAV